jgi:UDP-N-acetylmuramate: L-alanyl-gamma-D-glutamyl-meso-diaminopimelate ligase
MLAERGFRVTGSDADAYPPMSDQLRDAGIVVEKGFASDHILREPPDLVIIGNAVRRQNPEAQVTLDSGLPYLSFPDAVRQFFLPEKHSVVVAGTHGKTTCTSLVGWILTHAGRDPGILVGGVTGNLGGSFRIGQGQHFVIEGDEYDTAFFDKTPKFLHYDARTLLLTSCEFDHADIYGSLEEIQNAFRRLTAGLPRDGRIIAATDVEAVRDVVTDVRAKVEGYGFNDPAMWRVSDVVFDREGTQFTVWRADERMDRLWMPLYGRHNVENLLGAAALCYGLGVSFEAMAEAMREYRGVRRRQEVRGEVGGVVVVDDFAHHPTAVYETLMAMRSQFPDHRIWAIFEPRTNTSRRRFFEDAYVNALSGADQVVIAEVFRADQIPEDERMRPSKVVEGLCGLGVQAEFISDVDGIIDQIVRNRTGKDVACIMSNGGFGGIWDRLLARLKQLEGR